MYQVKVFSAANPIEVEKQANIWLQESGKNKRFRLIHAAPTDVIQVSMESGIQRYTLIIAYETD